MRFTVTVLPSARTEKVERSVDGTLRVSVNAPPREGRANAAVVVLLAAHFGVPKTRVRIIRGHAGRRKVIEIAGL